MRLLKTTILAVALATTSVYADTLTKVGFGAGVNDLAKGDTGSYVSLVGSKQKLIQSIENSHSLYFGVGAEATLGKTDKLKGDTYYSVEAYPVLTCAPANSKFSYSAMTGYTLGFTDEQDFDGFFYGASVNYELDKDREVSLIAKRGKLNIEQDGLEGDSMYNRIGVQFITKF